MTIVIGSDQRIKMKFKRGKRSPLYFAMGNKLKK